MRLIRFGLAGQERPGVILEDDIMVDIAEFGEDYTENFFASNGIERLSSWITSNRDKCPVISGEVRLGPPIQRPSKIVCVGLNYAQHAAESGMEIPKEPVIFFKSTTAICGPFDEVMLPKGSKCTDWEVELALVISNQASYVEESEAMNYLGGYMLHNDISERDFQLKRGGEWEKGKSCDTFAPLGPFLATKDEIPDPDSLNLWLKVNGKLMQNANTSDLIFKIPQLISYISSFMTLLPGDIISTGTPFGVGLGFNPPQYLKPGDIMELGIDGLGTSRQTVRGYSRI